MSSRMIVLALAAAVLVVLASSLDAAQTQNQTNTVRISLRKHTSMQAGQGSTPVTSYFAQMEVGTPGKKFNMLVDVNAREVWLPHYSKMGLVYSRLNYKNGYCKKDSRTSIKEPNDVFKIQHSGCELSGKAYRDVFKFADVVESVQPVAYEQRFLAISCASNDKFTQFGNVDGVLGFSPWPISEIGSDLVTVAMNRARLTGELRFGLALKPELDGSDGGELTIGGVNQLRFSTASLQYHHLVSQHNWAVSLQKVLLGANSIDACSASNSGSASSCPAVLATNTNNIYGPPEAIKTLLNLLNIADVDKKFKDSSVFEIDCLKVADAPALTFVIDGAFYKIPATSYIKKKVDGFLFKSSTCYVALLANNESDQWVLGTNFLANYYSIFDMTKRAVALAQLR